VPHATVKRQIGKLNIGFYCEKCSEFFALMVVERRHEHVPVEFVADAPQPFECPFCHHHQMREVSEFLRVHLTEGNKRKPPTRH
jgi:hypothetical protein